MYLKRIAFLFLAFFSFALQINPAAAAFSIEYQASADPTTQGFSAYLNVPPAPQVIGPIANDLGYPAWSISGLGLSSQFVYLTGALNAAQKADINSQGFTLTLRARALQGNAPAYDAGSNTIIGGAALAIGSTHYTLELGINSSGNTVAVLVYSLDPYGPEGSVRAFGPSYTLNDAGYHTYDLVLNPSTQLASLFVDGVERISGYTGYPYTPSADWGLVFGALSGGGMNFNLVRLTSPAVVPADPNLIDATYGAGAGSFELGTFVSTGGWMELLPGYKTIKGWTVGNSGDGVDWLTEPYYRADTGSKSVDLQHVISGGSIATSIPTVPDHVYKLSFSAATASGYNNAGAVSAGSLVNQPFTATYSSSLATQTYTPFTFLFSATAPTTTIRFVSTGASMTYGPAIDSVSVQAVSADLCGDTLKASCSYEFALEQGAQKTESIQFFNTGVVPRTATLEVINPHSDLAVSLSQSTVSIGAGQTQTLPINLNASVTPVGVYDDLLLKVTVDDGGTLYASIKVNVGAGPLPDLAITANDIGSVTNANDSVTLTATVHNRGTAPASNVQVRFYEFDNPLGEPTITQIAPNGIGSASITVPAMTAGDHLIRVAVDPADAIAELDETNNEASRIISVDPSGPTEGHILVTASPPTTVYTGSLFTLSGSAVYDLYVNGVRNTDYVVKGGAVRITVEGNAVYGAIHTDVNGNFVKTLQAPATPGTYRITMTVTDKTFVGTRDLTFKVESPPPTPPSPPLPPPLPNGDRPAGAWGPGSSPGEWIWIPAPGSGPAPASDLRVFAENIHFSRNNPAANQEITVFAEILYWASSTTLIAGNVPVNIYATDVASQTKVKIGQTVIPHLSVGSPDFGSRYVYATWKNQGDGIYLIEFAIDPSYVEANLLNNAATRAIGVGQAADPNDKVGPLGEGTERLLPRGESLSYMVLFENLETATAPARELVISDQLDTATLDLGTLSLGPIAFGETIVTPRPGSSTYSADVDLRPGKDLIVRIEANLDRGMGLLVWRFSSIDPTTGQPTTDPLAGFLPPNVNSPEGSGSVRFTVMPHKGLPTDTVTCNQAEIVFDTNEPIVTSQWCNKFKNDGVDTTPPTITVPDNITTEATSPNGAAVTFTASATDLVDGSVPVNCTPASGSTFPLGPTTVNCAATDQAGNTANGSFTVTVVDTTPPTLTVPGAMTVEATSSSGATVTFNVSATDTASAAVPVNCVPPSGSTFPLGATTVNCTATDQAGNPASSSFTVTVRDTTPPTVTVPANITVSTTSSTGANVSYSGASATDLVDGTLTPTCTPASGSFFDIGATAVTCSATDSHGNTESAVFNVTVTTEVIPDRQPPVVSAVTATPNPVSANTNVTLTATINDTATRGSSIASADYRVGDGGAWTPMSAADGAFNSPNEPVKATLTLPQVGTYTVCVRGTDAASNTSAGTCITITVSQDQGCNYTDHPVVAVVPYNGTDIGQNGSGLRLTSMGRIYDSQGASLYTVWRIRNGSNDDKPIKLDAYKTSWVLEFTAQARTETFIASTIVAGPATHRLFYNNQQVDVKASSNATYNPPPCSN